MGGRTANEDLQRCFSLYPNICMMIPLSQSSVEMGVNDEEYDVRWSDVDGLCVFASRETHSHPGHNTSRTHDDTQRISHWLSDPVTCKNREYQSQTVANGHRERKIRMTQCVVEQQRTGLIHCIRQPHSHM